MLDLSQKIPKSQHVDFPSVYQCIQQLAIPLIVSSLSGTPQARGPHCY
uniref:Uncharacterized protein n=1 Tax=Anguilla anguilla TaxID=7936 RepID=A0A0E9XHD5_ANGAN